MHPKKVDVNSNKHVVYKFINAINDRNWSVIKSIVHSDFIRRSYSDPKIISSDTGIVDFYKNEAQAFPDLKQTILFAIEEGDLVATRILFEGTQDGPLGSLPPTGKMLIAAFNCFFKVTDNQLKEAWVEYDNLHGLIQLGHYRIIENTSIIQRSTTEEQ